MTRVERLQAALTTWSFRGRRAEFWRDAAAMTRAKRPLLGWLEALAAREPSSTRGKMASLWTRAMSIHPEFATASAPYLPAVDRVMLQAAEDAADKAEVYDLLAEQIELSKNLRGQLVSALILPGLTMCALIAVVYSYGSQLFPEFASIMPLERWQPMQAQVARVTMFLAGRGGLGVVAGLLAIVAWCAWSINNYTGRGRRFLDDHVFPWKLVRAMRGIETSMAMATMLKARVSWRRILAQLETMGSPWMRWQVAQVSQRAKTIRAAEPLAALDTGILSKDLYYRLTDYAASGSTDLSGLLLTAARDEARTLSRRLDVLSNFLVTGTYVVIAVVFMLLWTSVPQITPDAMRTR